MWLSLNEINHFALINVYEQLLALKQSKQCEPFVDAFYTPILSAIIIYCVKIATRVFEFYNLHLNGEKGWGCLKSAKKGSFFYHAFFLTVYLSEIDVL